MRHLLLGALTRATSSSSAEGGKLTLTAPVSRDGGVVVTSNETWR